MSGERGDGVGETGGGRVTCNDKGEGERTWYLQSKV